MIVEFPDPSVRFVVYGTPATKGNKSAFPVRRGGALTGQVVLREGKSESFKDWNRRVVEVVQGIAEDGAPLLDGPIVASVSFYLPKPSTAPKRKRTWPMRKPDLDKLLRAILDPMIDVVIADDARIVEFSRLEKVYAVDATPEDPRPRAEVALWRYEEFHGLP